MLPLSKISVIYKLFSPIGLITINFIEPFLTVLHILHWLHKTDHMVSSRAACFSHAWNDKPGKNKSKVLMSDFFSSELFFS